MKKFLLTAVFAFISALVLAQERIAVFPFEDMDNVLTRNEAVMYYQEFSNEFTNRSVGRFSVVPRQDIERLINTEAAFQLSDFSDRVKTAEMQRVLNGTQILSGRIGKLGNDIRIIVSLYTYPELVQLPGGTTLSVANKNELFGKIPELVQQMQDRIANATVQSVPEGLLYEIVNGRTITITGYTGNATTLNIPAQIQGLPVTVIGGSAFCERFSLTSVIIPTSVTAIGDYAFNRSGLTSVTIPSSVTSIGNEAFSMSSLTSVTIPSSVTAIGRSAFSHSNLTNITVDSRNPAYASIDGVLFDKNIRTIISYPEGKTARTYTIPSSVTSIGNNAFDLCRSLTSVTIPSSVMSIGEYAFSNCHSLTSVTIPSSITSIETTAFFACISLTNITLDNRNSAYASIDGVIFDKNIRTIISYPQGKNQRTYVIPSSVRSIGEYAFCGCENLTSITIPSSVTSIGDSAFLSCSNLTSITIPSSVTSISDSAFIGCSSLTSITIPSSVTSIGDSAFIGCSSLTSITIPSSVTSIGAEAFKYCDSLTSVTIPYLVTAIEEGTFDGCKSLTNVTISSSVAYIGINTFRRCSLTVVTIPNSVTSIEEGAFTENQITSVTIGAYVDMYDNSFEYSFPDFYYEQGRIAGTYTYRNGTWSRR